MLDPHQDNSSNAFSKYNKLITDYKSLREKYNILKPAIINEREKCKNLEKTIMEYDIQSRKLNQEIDSLKFRNELLTKQLNNLRDELDNERIKKSRKFSINRNNKDSDDPIDVLKEELTNKITECSSLHTKISSLKSDAQIESSNYRSAINDLENQLKLLKEQKELTESNIKQDLANEIEERTNIESELDKRDQTILKLRNSEQNLIKEINTFKSQFPEAEFPEDKNIKYEEKFSEEIKSYDESNSNSNLVFFNTNETYTCSLIDKIANLEQTINSNQLNYEIIMKRYNCEKKYKEQYEQCILENGVKLPKIDLSLSKEEYKDISDFGFEKIDFFISKFYEDKIQKLTKQLYQVIAKTGVYYDELKIFENKFEIESMEKTLIVTENESLKQRLNSVQEDLELTQNQYESKLKEMSIHIAQLCSQLEASYNVNKTQKQLAAEESNKGLFSSFRK